MTLLFIYEFYRWLASYIVFYSAITPKNRINDVVVLEYNTNKYQIDQS